MHSYRARFFFDWGSGRCLWAADDPTGERYGYAIDHHELDPPEGLVAELDRLESWRNTALNWDYPPDPGPWRESECTALNIAVATALKKLRTALGDGWAITNENRDLHEDPDLDRYLVDPKKFSR